MRRRVIRDFSSICLIMFAACHDVSSFEMPAEATVFIEIRPGKPGAPAESIELKKLNTVFTLQVRRVDTYGKLIAEKTIELPREDFVSLWNIVQRKDLGSFKPRETAETVFDFGERRLRIVWRIKENSEIQTRDIAWTNPLENEESIDPLFSKFAHLASSYVKDIHLYYFPSQ